MNLHEYQGKQLFAEYGLPVSTGYACDTPEEAAQAPRKGRGQRIAGRLAFEAAFLGSPQQRRANSAPQRPSFVCIGAWAPFLRKTRVTPIWQARQARLAAAKSLHSL